MDYRELLEKYGVRLFDCCNSEREFTAYELANGWAWWNEQTFRNDGYVCCHKTNKLYRLSSNQELIGKCKYRIYSIGEELPSKDGWLIEDS